MWERILIIINRLQPRGERGRQEGGRRAGARVGNVTGRVCGTRGKGEGWKGFCDAKQRNKALNDTNLCCHNAWPPKEVVKQPSTVHATGGTTTTT